MRPRPDAVARQWFREVWDKGKEEAADATAGSSRSGTRSTDRERTRTALTVETARHDVGLKEEDFSRRELERGGR